MVIFSENQPVVVIREWHMQAISCVGLVQTCTQPYVVASQKAKNFSALSDRV